MQLATPLASSMLYPSFFVVTKLTARHPSARKGVAYSRSRRLRRFILRGRRVRPTQKFCVVRFVLFASSSNTKMANELTVQEALFSAPKLDVFGRLEKAGGLSRPPPAPSQEPAISCEVRKLLTCWGVPVFILRCGSLGKSSTLHLNFRSGCATTRLRFFACLIDPAQSFRGLGFASARASLLRRGLASVLNHASARLRFCGGFSEDSLDCREASGCARAGTCSESWGATPNK